VLEVRQTRLVYSTRSGRICPTCGQPADGCVCKSASRVPPSDGIVRVRREVKGRHGKTVTIVAGIPRDPDALDLLAAELKRLCGAGGSAKDGVIVIQGDHVDLLITELSKRGHTVKRAGG
jgi:translation initiation factor 1